MSSSHGLVDSWEYIISQSPTPHFLFQRDNIVASAALPKILILNSTCYIYIYISMVSMWQFQIPNGFPKYIEETIWTIAKELELPFIPPGARTFARGRGTLSPRAGRLPGASQKPSPRIPVLWMQKKHLETIPSHGGCMAVAHIHSNWGNYFHTYNFSLWFSAYSQQT